MQILDGKLVSQAVKDNIREKMNRLQNAGKKIPHLVAVLVGNDGASETYVASKVKSCAEVGFKSTLVRLDKDIAEGILLSTIEKLNLDEDVDGILIQLPLPKQISENKVINSISPEKDVDGFHPINIGRMAQGQPADVYRMKTINIFFGGYRIDDLIFTDLFR